MNETNNFINADCFDVIKTFPNNSIDMVLTSPPYDDVRTYDKTLIWNFEIFSKIAKEIIRIMKEGSLCVWVVGDSTVNGSETCSSFKQILFFVENGLKLHDTMIWKKNKTSFPAAKNSKRYTQIFEYMFVLSKGKIRKDINLICDKKNKWAGYTNWGKNTCYNKDGNIILQNKIKPVPEFSLRENIWEIPVGVDNNETHHPAVFPIKLATDNILSWSIEKDIVLDPFSGSGTTAIACYNNNRKFICIEKNKEYYDASCERYAKHVRLKNMKGINE